MDNNSNSRERFGVALVKYACPICGKVNEDATAVAVNRRLTKPCADKVRELNGQCVGFSEKPCKECQSYIDKGAFFIIGVDGEKSTDMRNPYRSGHLVGISKKSDFYASLPEEYKRKPAVFMDYREMMALKMIAENK
jgi:hypothetical protein